MSKRQGKQEKNVFVGCKMHPPVAAKLDHICTQWKTTRTTILTELVKTFLEAVGDCDLEDIEHGYKLPARLGIQKLCIETLHGTTNVRTTGDTQTTVMKNGNIVPEYLR